MTTPVAVSSMLIVLLKVFDTNTRLPSGRITNFSGNRSTVNVLLTLEEGNETFVLKGSGLMAVKLSLNKKIDPVEAPAGTLIVNFVGLTDRNSVDAAFLNSMTLSVGVRENPSAYSGGSFHLFRFLVSSHSDFMFPAFPSERTRRFPLQKVAFTSA